MPRKSRFIGIFLIGLPDKKISLFHFGQQLSGNTNTIGAFRFVFLTDRFTQCVANFRLKLKYVQTGNVTHTNILARTMKVENTVDFSLSILIEALFGTIMGYCENYKKHRQIHKFSINEIIIMAKDNTTPRSYTLRLRGADNNDRTWREHLWRTHAAVNLGAKIFGDFLLTFCGGISHKLVDEFANQKGMGETKDRRIILALSWLSVEDKAGAPKKKYRVEPAETENALRNILEKRGINKNEIDSWLVDCRNSINAAIREDAVWVNRSMMFDALQKEWDIEINENDLWDFLACKVVVNTIIKPEQYMQPALPKEDKKKKKQNNDDDGEQEGESSQNPKQDKPKEMSKAALNWLSKRLGSGEGSNFEKIANNLHDLYQWCLSNQESLTGVSGFEFDEMLQKSNLSLKFDKSGKGVNGKLKSIYEVQSVSSDEIEKLIQITEKAYKEAKSKINGKGIRPYAQMIKERIEQETGFTYVQTDAKTGKVNDNGCHIFCVMLDHAARKIISRLSGIKNQELKRIKSEEGGQVFEKLKSENPEIVQLLDDYCQERSKNSNADDAYRIRKAALGGWEEVVTVWKVCNNETERKEAAGRQQDNENIKKFGDINLFRDLAKDEYCLLWANTDLLKNYATGQQAEYDKRRFKVPTYRHPDPLKHPVYCDYAESRPNVSFTVRQYFKNLKNAKPKKPKGKEQQETLQLRRIHLDLIDANDGSLQQNFALRWQGKRLAKDIGLDVIEISEGKSTEDIPRFDRFGQIDTLESKPMALAIYEDKWWYSRLQVSRKELDQLAKVVKKDGGNPFDRTTWCEKALKMLGHLKWFVSFSPKLCYPGTWNRYLRKMFNEVKASIVDDPTRKNKKKTIYEARDCHDDVMFFELPFIGDGISGGIGRLSGIPHLRILAMDLGHRFGASCAVWEVISKKDIEKAAAEHGQEPPEKCDLSFFLKTKDNKTLVFRRIADDSAKEACWARLERQFTIKLQGEDDAHKPRKTTTEEIDEAKLFLKHLGRELSSDDEKELNHIDTQLTLLMNAFRLALRRHSDLIRVARDVKADVKILPGNKEESLKDEEKPTFVLNAIRTWFNLRQTRRWICHEQINTLWEEYIVPLMNADTKELDAIASAEKKKSDNELPERSLQKRKADQKTWDEAFQLVADALLKQGQKKLKQIAAEFDHIWREHDDEMRQRMREIRRLVMPRQGLKKSEKKKKITKEFRKKISRRGGLSMARINLIRELYQVAKAFYMRPGGGKDKIERGDDSIKNFGQRILKAHEELRRNRVKQLASRIVEAALGLGQEKKPVKFNSPKTDGKNTLLRLLDQKRDHKAPENPRFAPCHAIVIENLDNYRPDQKQTRREARMLMQWASAKTRDLLKEHCQLYGLFLMEVSANYTSRQDSRTGKPGMRCKEIPAIQFKEPKGYLQKLIDRIEKKKEDRSPREKLIAAIAKKCEKITPDVLKNMRAFRIPWQGGDLFVAAGTENMGIQADLNAAANIGLKALTNQESPIAHWRVTCNRKGLIDFKDNGGKKNEIAILKNAKDHKFLDEKQIEKAKGEKSVNAWRNVSTDPLKQGNWEYTVTYWRNVEEIVCRKLAEYNKLDDDVSF